MENKILIYIKNTILILTVFLLNGCCAFTSRDCGCDLPEPRLSEASLDWVNPFDNHEFFVYEDGNGNIDTLEIGRMQDTEFIGGVECGIDSDVERVILKSNNTILLTISATRVHYAQFNDIQDTENYIYVELNTMKDEIDVLNDNSSANFKHDFEWNGELISVLEIKCEGSVDCNSLEMKNFIISKEHGLLKFEDTQGDIWTKIN